MSLREALDPPVPAIVLAEGKFGDVGGKTAHGVVMHSDLFAPAAIVDSETAGETPAAVLDRAEAPDVPIVPSVAEALEIEPDVEALVIGVAPAGGQLPETWVRDIEAAIKAGCDVVSGLHTFLGDDDKWASLADQHGVRIFDVRKPPEDDRLRVAAGSVDDVAEVVLVLGTDCAVGKRTTTYELFAAAREAGRDAGWVATGQTGLMVGAHDGVVIDRVPADFTAGVVEDIVTNVAGDHDLVFVEGQASLTHRAYSGVTLSILHGAWPDVVVLADDPDRRVRAHFEQFSVDGIDAERRLVEDLSDAVVAGVSTWGDAERQAHYDLPAANAYDDDGAAELLEAIDGALEVDHA